MTPSSRTLNAMAIWLVAILSGVPSGAPAGAQSMGQPGGVFPHEAARDAERLPVLLVPGWGDDAADIEPLRQRFLENGWTERQVSALSFSDPVGSNRTHANEVAVAVRVLMGLTGADRIDVVAHSMGGLAVREHFRLLEDEDPVIRRVVFLGTPHRGTVAAALAWGDGGREMIPGSDFLNRLNELPGVPDGVEALALRTPIDLRVIPTSSSRLHGEAVENVEICCPTHQGLVDDERTFEEVLQFLLVGRGQPAPTGGS